jgi:diaminohydroxyphosphoribosylaminopyrimidine deaminase/5-amino-6-(5-phosphoribosylamino)uracil reductase
VVVDVVTDADAAFMARALFWAERGRGRTSPNPFVGAVVVTPAGIVVGQGTTEPAGGPHAEVVALDAAGDLARGSTLYVTLEPCSHTGRTGPCVERVVAAGIRRVVLAVTDPNPKVSGRGAAYLQSHGIEVLTGVGRGDAVRQHAPFFTWMTRHRPWVVAKAAVSIDGFVGAAGEPVRLTGATADRYLHRQRAEVDAIAIGSGTALADDPLLTPRGAYRHRPLVRVVFDWQARVPASARLFSTLNSGPVIMIVTESARERHAAHVAGLERMGVEVEAFAARDLGLALTRLGERPILSLLVEGGPALHAAMAAADLIDRVQTIWTPRRLWAGLPAADVMTRARSESPVRTIHLGADRLVEYDVHGTD